MFTRLLDDKSVCARMEYNLQPYDIQTVEYLWNSITKYIVLIVQLL